jgi:hypothetical protein
MENFGFDQYLAACPPRIREFLEAVSRMCDKTRNVEHTREWYTPALATAFAILAKASSQTLNLLQCVMTCRMKKAHVPESMREDAHIMGIGMSISQGNTIFTKMAHGHLDFLTAFRDLMSFKFTCRKIDTATKYWSRNEMKRLAIGAEPDMSHYLRVGAWENYGRISYVTNALSSSWSGILSPQYWSVKVVGVFLRMLCRITVDSALAFQARAIDGNRLLHLSRRTVRSLIRYQEEQDVIMRFITSLRMFWKITGPVGGASQIDPLAPTAFTYPKRVVPRRQRSKSTERVKAKNVKAGIMLTPVGGPITFWGKLPTKYPPHYRKLYAEANAAKLEGEADTSSLNPVPIPSSAILRRSLHPASVIFNNHAHPVFFDVRCWHPAALSSRVFCVQYHAPIQSWMGERRHGAVTKQAMLNGYGAAEDNVNMGGGPRYDRPANETAIALLSKEQKEMLEKNNRSGSGTIDMTLWFLKPNTVPTLHLPDEYAVNSMNQS